MSNLEGLKCTQTYLENNLDTIFYNLELVGISREDATEKDIIWSANDCWEDEQEPNPFLESPFIEIIQNAVEEHLTGGSKND